MFVTGAFFVVHAVLSGLVSSFSLRIFHYQVGCFSGPFSEEKAGVKETTLQHMWDNFPCVSWGFRVFSFDFPWRSLGSPSPCLCFPRVLYTWFSVVLHRLSWGCPCCFSPIFPTPRSSIIYQEIIGKLKTKQSLRKTK